jgi:hypothetical protein
VVCVVVCLLSLCGDDVDERSEMVTVKKPALKTPVLYTYGTGFGSFSNKKIKKSRNKETSL